MLLHIGVHKTGTTAVQTALANSRDILGNWQVRYPGQLMAHRDVASSVMGRPLGWRTDGARPPQQALWNQVVKAAHAYQGITVISSEFFAESPDDVVRRIAKDMTCERLQIVITLRNLGRILPSAWQQNLKSGFEIPYLPWLQRMLFKMTRPRATPFFGGATATTSWSKDGPALSAPNTSPWWWSMTECARASFTTSRTCSTCRA